MRPRLLLAAVLLLATALLPPLLAPARADDGAAGLRFFEDKHESVGKACGKKLWEVVESARRNAFHEYALDEAKRLVRDFDPDHADARELLGYVRKGKQWELDEAAAAKVPHQNTKVTTESQASYDKRVEKWREELRRAGEFIAAKYAVLGNQCAQKGYSEQARKAWERALGHDPQNEEARKGLGHVKLGKLWLTPAQRNAILAAVEGQWVTEPSRLEKGLGVALHKMQSTRFRVEDDGDRAALPDAVKAVEVAYVYYLADIGRDPLEDVFGGRVAELCVVTPKPVWDKWVDQFSNAYDKEWTKGSNTCRDLAGLAAGTLRSETAEHVDTRDPLIHHAVHFLNHHVWAVSSVAWIDEGLAYYYTVKVQDTTRTHCVEKFVSQYSGTEVVGGDKDWSVSENWKSYLREIVGRKQDEELRKIMGTRLAELNQPMSVKGWGVVSWLMDTRRDEFLAYLAALRDRKKDDDPVALFEKHMGTSVESVDRDWREFAKRAY